MMETLFKLTELEARVGVNMNVLVDGVVPRVVSLGEALGNGSTIAATCCAALAPSPRARSSTGSNCWPA